MLIRSPCSVKRCQTHSSSRHLRPVALPVRAGAFQHRVEKIAPDVRPLHLEPRREPLGLGLELRLERIDPDPAPVRDLADVDVDRAVVPAIVHPAVLVLRAERPILRVVLELVEELERAREAELLLEPPRQRVLHRLAPARVRAARVRPVVRPERLRRRALLQQQLVAAVEDEDRECTVQHARAGMTLALRLRADLPIELIDEDKLLVLVGYDFVTHHLLEPPRSRASPEIPRPVSRSPQIRTPRATHRLRRSSRRLLPPSALRRAHRSRVRSSRAARARAS